MADLATRAYRLASATGAIPRHVGTSRLEALRHPAQAIYITSKSEPWGASLTVRSPTEVLAQIDHDASNDALSIRQIVEVGDA